MKFGKLAAWPDPEGGSVDTLRDRRGKVIPEAWARLAAIRNGFVAQCHDWRRAAEADGWSIEATYEGEPLEQAWRARRDGYQVLGIARPENAHTKGTLPVATLAIWGPDGLAISPPPIYDWPAIQLGAQTCMGCDAAPVPTERVAFVGRYCATCAPLERAKQEKPGWCD